MKNVSVFVAILCAATFAAMPLAHGQVSFDNGPELLGRPTNNSITIQLIANMGVRARVQYGTTFGSYTHTTTAASFNTPISSFSDYPVEIVVSGLSADTTYYYRIQYCRIGSGTCTAGSETWISRSQHTFHTKRSAASSFVFTITADTHVGFPSFSDEDVWLQTLDNIVDDAPDFNIDLGDTFTMDSNMTESTTRNIYLQQRKDYFSQISHSVPLFLALGNHENEEGWNRDDDGANLADNVPILSINARKRYFLNPNPLESPFYTGDMDADCPVAGVSTTNTIPCSFIDGDHLREDYYAWEWGSALFVVLDPYFYTMKKPYDGPLGGEDTTGEVVGDPWDWTLGAEQYWWLKDTLEASTATFKFVFSHQVTGGAVASQDYGYGRGGAMATPYFEWGGHNDDLGETWGWDIERSGAQWMGAVPVHQLFIDNNVTAFFHGHDHVFAQEEVDGIIYQECPRASDPNYGTGFDYYPGIMIANSGHLRVTVSPYDVKVEYVRSFPFNVLNNGRVDYTYTRDADLSPIPFAQDDTSSVTTGESVSINVLANDTLGDLPSIVTITIPPNHGTANVNPDNTVTYVAGLDWTGVDTLTYQLEDGDGDVSQAVIAIVVGSSESQGYFIAQNDFVVTNEDEAVVIDVLVNDTVVNPQLTQVTLTALPTHGEVTVNDDGTINYQPSEDYNGYDSFIYGIGETSSVAAIAVVSVTISPVSDGSPIAQDDAIRVRKGSTTQIAVLENDTAKDLPLNVTIKTAPTHGVVNVNTDNTLTYTPDVGWAGQDTLVYDITDIDKETDDATVMITVIDDPLPASGCDCSSSNPGAASATIAFVCLTVFGFIRRQKTRRLCDNNTLSIMPL